MALYKCNELLLHLTALHAKLSIHYDIIYGIHIIADHRAQKSYICIEFGTAILRTLHLCTVAF